MVFALVVGPLLMGAATAKTLKIGTMSPLTGPYAADGNDIANGAKTAVAVILAEGGIPGYDKIEWSPRTRLVIRASSGRCQQADQ